MKPAHFINIRKHETCEECDHIYQHEDCVLEVCGLHDFTLPAKTNHYRCDDFKEFE